MLYEVITGGQLVDDLAAAPLAGGLVAAHAAPGTVAGGGEGTLVARGGAGQDVGAGAHAAADDRITSYNVCYTKLLRVFPVHFRRAMFLAPVRRARPKVIIGLGQRRGGRKLRLERQAVNRRGGRGERLRPVTPFGRSRLPVTLRLPRTAGTRLSTDAGTYVCNFSMYVFLEHCRATGARFV